MDFTKILTELRSQREQISQVIITLERLAAGSGKRRGRPPKWMVAATSGMPAASGAKSRRGRRKKAVVTAAEGSPEVQAQGSVAELPAESSELIQAVSQTASPKKKARKSKKAAGKGRRRKKQA